MNGAWPSENGDDGQRPKSTLPQPLTPVPDYHNFFINHHGLLEKSKGLGWIVTGLFIAGYSAGGGIVVLAAATAHTGVWLGVAQIIVLATVATYTAHALGESWLILLRRWPEYTRIHCRKPYAELAYRAIGWRMRNATSIILSLNQFGIAVVFLLLCAKNIHDALVAFFQVNINLCLMIVVVAVAVMPFLFLKSPQDFWGVCIMALFATAVAAVLILIATGLDYPVCSKAMGEEPLTIETFFLGLGTFIFAFAGHGAFPNIQHDMRKPYQATRASILAFTFMAALYLPVSIFGYYTYGNSIYDSIINNLQIKWIQQTVNLLITAHCFCTLTTIYNPIFQEAEDFFDIPHHFCMKRVLVRSGILLVSVFVAESVPSFGPLLDFMGGSFLSLLNLVFPCVFYLSLMLVNERKARGDHYPYPTVSVSYWLDVCRNTPPSTLFYNFTIILLGVVGGVAATWAAIIEISDTRFVPPCYVSMFMEGWNGPTGGGGVWNSSNPAFFTCCGANRNISRYGHPEVYC